VAERRMFAKTIIDSDAFLDMPLSTQSLYFHLSMRADDEGFINNPKKIQRMIGASDDDLKLLIAKSFIINFESGIIVIKHWKIHNYIRGDRLQKTKYQEERQLLEIKDNGAYTLGSGLKEISATEKRQIAYKESELPYCFTYKIRRAFDGKQCPICGGTMHSSSKTTMPTIQHNIPISKGGKHVIENISVICESCNTSIKDKETGALNNADVVRTWDAILIAEEQKIDWFYNTQLLDTIDVRQMSDICPLNVSIGKVRLGKVSIGKDSIYSANFTHFWEVYPKKKEKSRAYACYKARLNDGYSEDELLKAAQNYAQECKKEKREERYIKLAGTFLGPNTPFVDYLKGGDDDGNSTETHKLTDEELKAYEQFKIKGFMSEV